jgi:hypothetical protein
MRLPARSCSRLQRAWKWTGSARNRGRTGGVSAPRPPPRSISLVAGLTRATIAESQREGRRGFHRRERWPNLAPRQARRAAPYPSSVRLLTGGLLVRGPTRGAQAKALEIGAFPFTAVGESRLPTASRAETGTQARPPCGHLPDHHARAPRAASTTSRPLRGRRHDVRCAGVARVASRIGAGARRQSATCTTSHASAASQATWTPAIAPTAAYSVTPGSRPSARTLSRRIAIDEP